MSQLRPTPVAYTWVLLLLMAAAYLLLRLVSGGLFDADIRTLATLESKVPFAGEALADTEAEFSSRLVIHYGPAPDEQVLALKYKLSSALAAIADNSLDRANYLREQLQDFALSARYQRVSVAGQAELLRIGNPQLQRMAWSNLVRLGADRRDPLNLIPPLSTTSFDGWEPAHGSLIRRSDDGLHLLQVYQLHGDAFDIEVQERLQQILNSIKPADVPLKFYGAAFHASQAASTAKSEAAVLGSLSLLGLVLLGIFAFRALAPLLALLITVAASVTVGATAVAMVFGQIHVLALLLGTAVIGMSADYVLHLLCHRFEASTERNRDSAAVVARGVFVAAGTTVVAYSLLTGAEPALLGQLAVFAMAGLVAAVITVMLLADRLVDGWQPSHSLPLIPSGFLSRRLSGVPLLILVAAAVTGLVALTDSNNDPRQFIDLKGVENVRSADLEDSRFLLIHADDDEQLLQYAEQLAVKLNALKDAKTIAGWQGISQLLPSGESQRRSIESLRQRLLTQQGLESLSEVGLSSVWIGAEQRQLSVANPLSVGDIPYALKDAKLWRANSECSDACLATSVRLTGITNSQMLLTLSNQYDWLDWIDPVTSSRLALDTVQQGLLARMLIAFFAVMALLMIRYRQETLQVLQIPAVAILLAMVLAVILGQPFTLFHCAALLVGFGLALDYGVFTQESPTQSTLLAIVLSALTTLLAFGLLAFSSTPAVAWFGQTVAISVSVSALLAIGLTRIKND